MKHKTVITSSLIITTILLNFKESHSSFVKGYCNKFSFIPKLHCKEEALLHDESDASTTTTGAAIAKDINDINTNNNNNIQQKQLRILGICGGIGSGKSLCCEILSSNPNLFPNVIRCIDSDKVAHSVYEAGSEAIKEIRQAFGDDVISVQNGKRSSIGGEEETIVVDRQKLGKIVFSDENKMSELEKIVWPHVKSKIENICNETEQQLLQQQQQPYSDDNIKTITKPNPPIIIVEAAVMLEAGWEDLFDAMWIISSPSSIQQERLENKRGLDSIDAIQRIEYQKRRTKERGIGNAMDELQKGVVSAIIENDGNDLDELIMSLKKVWSDPHAWKKRS